MPMLNATMSLCSRCGFVAMTGRCNSVAALTGNSKRLWGPPLQRCSRTKGKAYSAIVDSQACATTSERKVVFLGTPEVAGLAFKELIAAAASVESNFEIVAVVTQPPRPKGRGNTKTPIPSPVHELAEQHGIPQERILTPVKANEEAFLDTLRAISPDLCITAAYGNMLPRRFLEIPRFGTLNIHPSLLPKYRGAAPVQRSLQDGVTETGVSVLFTVLKCDAGPVLAQKRVAVPADVQAPQLLDDLFVQGAQLLVSCLPDVFAGRGQELAVAQDETQATHAAKMSKEEGQLDFAQPALVLHNKVRAFAGWPGTFARVTIRDEASGKSETMDLKILRTTAAPLPAEATVAHDRMTFAGDVMLVPCGDGSVLQVLEVQVPTKKPASAKEFKNGLGRKVVLVTPVQ